MSSGGSRLETHPRIASLIGGRGSADTAIDAASPIGGTQVAQSRLAIDDGQSQSEATAGVEVDRRELPPVNRYHELARGATDHGRMHLARNRLDFPARSKLLRAVAELSTAVALAQQELQTGSVGDLRHGDLPGAAIGDGPVQADFAIASRKPRQQGRRVLRPTEPTFKNRPTGRSLRAMLPSDQRVGSHQLDPERLLGQAERAEKGLHEKQEESDPYPGVRHGWSFGKSIGDKQGGYARVRGILRRLHA